MSVRQNDMFPGNNERVKNEFRNGEIPDVGILKWEIGRKKLLISY